MRISDWSSDVCSSDLLNWIGSSPLRQEVTAETNKIESYNGFAKFFSFGGDVIAENDPDEQQKRLRYNDLIASAVILQNTVDMMRALQKLADDGVAVSGHDIAFFSPYRSEEHTSALQSLIRNSYPVSYFK